MSDPTPLTAEELASLRDGIERRAVHPWDGDAIVSRLLATLDAARSATTPTVCPACGGEGRVYRMTPAYEAMATQAGGSFGWTGATHEWRDCRPCGGSGLLDAARSAPSLDVAWAAAEAALPEGWYIGALTYRKWDANDPRPWLAQAYEPTERMAFNSGHGPTPAAALLALAAALPERQP